MRKLGVLLLLCMFTVVGFAQGENAGKFGTEIFLNPWKSKGNAFSLIDGAKFRYFTSNKFAIRTSLNLSNNNASVFLHDYDYDGEIVDQSNQKLKSTTFSIMPGVEYHFANYKRTSVYVGGEVGFEMNRTTVEDNNEDGKIVIKGYEFSNENSFKVGVFTGIDVYLLKNLYLGAEVGFQYKAGKTLDEVTTVTDPNGEKTKFTNKDYAKLSSLGFYCLPSVRIGWNF